MSSPLKLATLQTSLKHVRRSAHNADFWELRISKTPANAHEIKYFSELAVGCCDVWIRLQKDPESMTRKELTKLIAQVEKQMRAAAADLNFEQAAELRDKMIDLKKNLDALDK